MYLTQIEIQKLLKKKDLTQTNHAIGIIVNEIKDILSKKYDEEIYIEKGNVIVSLEDNYYALNYQKDEITLTSKYTKYLNEHEILRTQMSSVIPSLLRKYQQKQLNNNQLWMCPGIVYRRDVRDKTHIGEPHQLDIWYVNKEKHNRESLLDLVSSIISVIEKYKKQKVQWRYNETSHNYTEAGIEVEINHKGQWLEILECGLISKKILLAHGIENQGGLALGLGLERLVMIIKDISDIRALYSENELIKKQMLNLQSYKEISRQPSIKRDLSIALNEKITIEELTEKIYDQLNLDLKDKIESISLLNESLYSDLPKIAQERLGMKPQQKNMLIRVILRDIAKTLTSNEANDIYTQIYNITHENKSGYNITNKVE